MLREACAVGLSFDNVRNRDCRFDRRQIENAAPVQPLADDHLEKWAIAQRNRESLANDTSRQIAESG
jgi:hypothetical protein